MYKLQLCCWISMCLNIVIALLTDKQRIKPKQWNKTLSQYCRHAYEADIIQIIWDKWVNYIFIADLR